MIGARRCKLDAITDIDLQLDKACVSREELEPLPAKQPHHLYKTFTNWLFKLKHNKRSNVIESNFTMNYDARNSGSLSMRRLIMATADFLQCPVSNDLPVESTRGVRLRPTWAQQCDPNPPRAR